MISASNIHRSKKDGHLGKLLDLAESVLNDRVVVVLEVGGELWTSVSGAIRGKEIGIILGML